MKNDCSETIGPDDPKVLENVVEEEEKKTSRKKKDPRDSGKGEGTMDDTGIKNRPETSSSTIQDINSARIDHLLSRIAVLEDKVRMLEKKDEVLINAGFKLSKSGLRYMTQNEQDSQKKSIAKAQLKNKEIREKAKLYDKISEKKDGEPISDKKMLVKKMFQR